MITIYQGKVDEECCRAEVHKSGGFQQCSRAGSVTRKLKGIRGKLRFCRQHDPNRPAVLAELARCEADRRAKQSQAHAAVLQVPNCMCAFEEDHSGEVKRWPAENCPKHPRQPTEEDRISLLRAHATTIANSLLDQVKHGAITEFDIGPDLHGHLKHYASLKGVTL